MGRTLRFYVFLLVQTVTVYFSHAAYAADPDTLVRQLPRSFAGEFQWRDSVRVYKVAIKFTDVRLLDTGRVEAVGTGVYDAYGEISKVNIRAVIDPDDLFLEIWEHDVASEGTEEEGLYRGDLSADMQSITAMWRSFTDKSRGYLKLTAE